MEEFFKRRGPVIVQQGVIWIFRTMRIEPFSFFPHSVCIVIMSVTMSSCTCVTAPLFFLTIEMKSKWGVRTASTTCPTAGYRHYSARLSYILFFPLRRQLLRSITVFFFFYSFRFRPPFLFRRYVNRHKEKNVSSFLCFFDCPMSNRLAFISLFSRANSKNIRRVLTSTATLSKWPLWFRVDGSSVIRRHSISDPWWRFNCQSDHQTIKSHPVLMEKKEPRREKEEEQQDFDPFSQLGVQRSAPGFHLKTDDDLKSNGEGKKMKCKSFRLSRDRRGVETHLQSAS